MMKNLLMSYFLCAAGLFTPLAGLHRFYLEKPVSGFFYLFTWGFFGIGTIIDLIRMPTLVDNFNLRLLFSNATQTALLGSRAHLTSPERSILHCANNNDGVVTVAMASLASGLDLVKSKVELDRLYRSGFCNKDIDEDGHEIYQFKGLKAKKPIF